MKSPKLLACMTFFALLYVACITYLWTNASPAGRDGITGAHAIGSVIAFAIIFSAYMTLGRSK